MLRRLFRPVRRVRPSPVADVERVKPLPTGAAGAAAAELLGERAATRPTPLPTSHHPSTCVDDDRPMVVAWFVRGHRGERPQARCHRRRHDPCATPPLESLRDGQPRRHDVHRPVQQGRPAGDRRRHRRRRHCGDPRHARTIEVPSGLVDPMTKTRAEQAAALERWADAVEPEDLRVAGHGRLASDRRAGRSTPPRRHRTHTGGPVGQTCTSIMVRDRGHARRLQASSTTQVRRQSLRVARPRGRPAGIRTSPAGQPSTGIEFAKSARPRPGFEGRSVGSASTGGTVERRWERRVRSRLGRVARCRRQRSFVSAGESPVERRAETSVDGVADLVGPS